MTAAMTALAIGSDQVAGAAELAFESLFFVGLLLFVITLILNVVSDTFVRRVRQAVLMAATMTTATVTATAVAAPAARAGSTTGAAWSSRARCCSRC